VAARQLIQDTKRDPGQTRPKQIPPHGGRLVSRLAATRHAAVLRERAFGLRRIMLNARQCSDLQMIATGAFSPLEGFMAEADYRSVLDNMRLANGLPWSLPITLAVDRETGSRLKVGSGVALAREHGLPIALLELSDKYGYSKREEAALVYRTEDETHPGVAAVYAQGEVLLSGKVSVFGSLDKGPFPALSLPPAETRRIFAERGWRRVVGFQTRNPIHRAHEYLQKCALEIADGLFIHPLVGETKSDDIPCEVRMLCYQALLERYYPADRVVLAVWPAAMRYAGPREAIFHALVRKNYGCTHFVVGRDHAGVGNYYGPFDAHYVFDEFEEGELGITPLFFDNAFFCRACAAMATSKTCPHDEAERVILSGTRVREMLAQGQAPPEEFTRPEVARVLLEAQG
jgi:sulfate adenylyltransferase